MVLIKDRGDWIMFLSQHYLKMVTAAAVYVAGVCNLVHH